MPESTSPASPGAQPDPAERRSRPRRHSAAMLGIPLALVGGVVLASLTLLAAPTPAMVPTAAVRHAAPVAAEPPAGTTWIEGVVTDQANHAQDNVNVEAWPTDPSATAPAASALTYGGPPNDPTYVHGFFMLAVPSNQPYRIILSAVDGKEDGDAFRMTRYGHGRPIMVRNATKAAGRIRDLGPIAVARQGKVASTTKAVLTKAKITGSQRAKVRLKVTSPFVTDVTGKIVVRVSGKRLVAKLHVMDHGKTTLTLPRLKKSGKYEVAAKFVGSGTVHGSKAKPAKLTVKK